jgi:hypothetical protein
MLAICNGRRKQSTQDLREIDGLFTFPDCPWLGRSREI